MSDNDTTTSLQPAIKVVGNAADPSIQSASFLVRWTAVAAAGWVAAFFATWSTLIFVHNVTAALVSQFAVGAGVGAAQWFLLRSRLNRAAWWICVTAISWGMTWIIFEWLFSSLGFHDTMGPAMMSMRVSPPPLAYAVIGLAIGASQYYLLRSRMRRSSLWIPGTCVGWWLAAVVGEFEFHMLTPAPTYVLIEIFGWSLMGIVVGIVTGSVMLGLLRMAPERGGKIKSSARNCEGA